MTNEKKNQLDVNITTNSLLKFAMPSILSMLVMSLYSMADGIFVARLIGTTALSAVNICMPLIQFSTALGMMLATGGSAIIAKKMGEGKEREANENFTLITLAALVLGVLIVVVGLTAIDPLIRFLGANDEVYQYCYDFTFVILFFMPVGMFAMLYQVFFITAGRAKLGLLLNVLGGVATVLLNYILLAKFGMGISGSAFASGLGFTVPGIVGVLYFIFNRRGSLYLVKPKMDLYVLIKSCTNGSSEMVSNLSQSITLVLFNNILMRMAGADGVAAITILMYAKDLLISAYLGYSTGIAPIISYNYGKRDDENLKRSHAISMRATFIVSILVFALSEIFASPLVSIFTPQGTAVYGMAVHGFRIFALSFLFMGFSIYGSAMFTAFSDGVTSAVISFMRTLVFIVAAILLLPLVLGINGVWIAMPLAEILGLGVTMFYFKRYRGKYRYA